MTTNNNKRVLVLGAYGLLGTSLCNFLDRLGFEVLRQGRREGAQLRFDPLSLTDLIRIKNDVRPDVLINCVANTDVDACELDIPSAFIVNTWLCEVLAKVFPGHSGVQVVHFSSDQVYSGDGPHREGFPLPLNVYALTKLAGESSIISAGGLVLRTNFVGKSASVSRKSFTDWLYNRLISGEGVNGFEDVWFSPISICGLCSVVTRCISYGVSGVFNCGAAGSLSKADFAERFALGLHLPTSLVRRVSVEGSSLRARRPRDMTMDSSALRDRLSMDWLSVQAVLDSVIAEYS